MEEVQKVVGAIQGCEGEQLVLTDVIGKGGFGAVYRGRWRNLDVAVKVSDADRGREHQPGVMTRS